MKVIVVTWWVLSGIGKWISGSSLWVLLQSHGYKIFMQKFDWYLNADAGTINPFKHGECFVTEDGSETDLDIGHYERFLDTNMNQMSIFTSWKLMQEIMEKERRWDYLWNDVQIIPHFTDLVKEKIKLWYTSSKADISIVEVWGTIGDMENEAIVEAMRQLRQDFWYQNVFYVHLTYIPYLMASKELKTKPTQNSIKDLRSRWITPDMLICRADYEISEEILTKISYMTWVKKWLVIPAPTVDTIYRIPLDYQKHGLAAKMLDHLWLEKKEHTLKNRENLYHHIIKATKEIHIAMIGKYVWLEDAYYSLNEAIKIAWFYHDYKVKLIFIEAETLNWDNIQEKLGLMHGVCLPWWFGKRWIEGMILAAQYAREHKIPYLWICLWSQIMAIEFARNVLWYSDATSEEFDELWISQHHVIHIMETQKSVIKKWWSMRLGSFDCILRNWSKVEEIYKGFSGNNLNKSTIKNSLIISERHRHRYEFNNFYRKEFENHGFMISGTSPDDNLVEMVELIDHPFMIASQAHPELQSRPTRPHPLFLWFLWAAITKQLN